MKRRVIGVDCDDTLIHFARSIFLWHDWAYKTKIPQDTKCYDIHVPFNCTPEESNRRVVEFVTSEEHMELQPLEGALEVMNMCVQRYDMYPVIISSRNQSLQKPTEALIEKQFPGIFKEVYCLGHFSGGGKKVTKREVCEKLGVELFIDDHPDHVSGVSGVGIPSLLFHQPWNEDHVLQYPAQRVYSWRAISNLICSMFI
jgi:5'(3')-deoxyribonucleotidase